MKKVQLKKLNTLFLRNKKKQCRKLLVTIILLLCVTYIMAQTTNTKFGDGALLSNITGFNNTANGYRALYSNGIGCNNTANGYGALYSNTNGNYNTANGNEALYGNTTGSYNTANGYQALHSNTNGYNTAIGNRAGYLSQGSKNVFIGNEAGYSETGSNKLYIANDRNGTLIYGDFATSKVGIGTTAPNAPLHISSAIDNIITFQTTDNSWLYTNWVDNSGRRRTWMGLDADLSSFNINVENGTNKILFNGGNVGIGTMVPDAKLHVVGKVKIVDDSQAAGRVLTSDANGLATWAPVSTTTANLLLTGYTSTAGTITPTDNIVQAIGKLNGNDALKAPLASPTFTGTVTAPTFVGSLTGNATTVTTNANLTGDVTSVGNTTTLRTVNANVGTFNSITVNEKGLVIAASNVPVPQGPKGDKGDRGDQGPQGTDGALGSALAAASSAIGAAGAATAAGEAADLAIKAAAEATAKAAEATAAAAEAKKPGPKGDKGDKGDPGSLDAWSLAGNSLTSPGTNFIGTINAVDWVVKTNNTERIRVTAGGNVGIGNTDPKDGLVIGTTYSFHSGGHKVIGIGFSPSSGKALDNGYVGELRLDPQQGKLSLGVSSQSQTPGGSVGEPPYTLVIDKNSNVGIGTTNPTEKLSVNGTIRAKKVVVETGWADYVFDKNYTLMPLHQVESFIKQNQHLPNMPTTKQVETQGLDMGAMQVKTMEKIEELTLYVIALQKENEELKTKLSQLETLIKQ